jgi:hypothetical protein
MRLLGGGMDVTRMAIELGYGSTAAFVYAFRTDMGCSPRAYMRGGWPVGEPRTVSAEAQSPRPFMSTRPRRCRGYSLLLRLLAPPAHLGFRPLGEPVVIACDLL